MPLQVLEWVFVLDEDYAYSIRQHLPQDLPNGWVFVDSGGTPRLEIHPNGDARVLKGYAWDGCTPKFGFWDIVIGIPDGVPSSETRKPKAYYASLLHDALYQFLDAGLPISRESADRIFLEILEQEAFAPRGVYYFAVRYPGWFWRKLTRWKRSYAGKRLPM